MNNSNGSATVTKAKKNGVSFVARVAKTRSIKGLTALVSEVGNFPCTNPVTQRRRKRAIVNRYKDFGVNVRVNGNFGIVKL